MTSFNSNSSWNRSRVGRITSPDFSAKSPKVIFDFPNRAESKIFLHNPGFITFRTSDLTERRNKVIEENIDVMATERYRYPSISHAHIPASLMDTQMRVLGHGTPTRGGLENCTMISATCSDGTDTQCQPGKCLVGKVSKVAGTTDKWKYESLTLPSLYYFVYGEKEIRLKSVLRGKFNLPAGVGVVNVTVPASFSTVVYLPPAGYAEETFTRRIINRLDQNGVLIGIEDSANTFVRGLLQTNLPTISKEQEVYDRLLLAVESEVSGVWNGFVKSAVDAVWANPAIVSNRDFALGCYSSLSALYLRGIQETVSGFSLSTVVRDAGLSRPVYNRLPGVSGAYKSEEGGTVAEWLSAGVDEQLGYAKGLLDTFYTNFLNPDTCKSENLDWMAQHLGFVGSLWDLSWRNNVKRLLVKNAHTVAVSGDIWTTDGSVSTLDKIDLSRIERVSVNQITGEVTTAYRYSIKTYNTTTQLTSYTTSNTLKVNTSRWQGLLPSKGSMISLMFMFWALGIKAHSPEELVFNPDEGTYRVKSGLRANEYLAPINIPYTVDSLRVGSTLDAEVKNFTNQLIAGIGVCQDDASSNIVIIRMPFYYNRNGRTWDATSMVVENYLPATTRSRLQYAYSAADLLVAEDIFFEPVPQ